MTYVRNLLLVAAFSLSSVSLAAEPSPGKQVPQSVKVKSGEATRDFHYWLYLPQGADKPDAKFPLIVFLHGSGERGDDLDLVKKHGPPKIIEARPELEFIVVSPQCPSNARWNVEELKQLVDHVTKTLKVDEHRLYLTGLSMGGGGTWDFAAVYPDRFAAIAPICGRADPATAEKIKHVPTWVFHGAKDSAVSLEQSTKMVEALKAAGGAPKFTVYPDAGHDSWTVTYDNPEFYAWLLQQKKSGAGGN